MGKGQASEDNISIISDSINLVELREDLNLLDELMLSSKPAVDSWEDFSKRLNKKSKSKPDIITTLWVGLILILVALSGFWVYQYIEANAEQKMTTEIGEMYAGTLPDKSRFELNAVSTLSYKPGRWNIDRTINLKGQAYFEVEKGSVFSVITEDGIINVLGTKFDVEAFGNYMKVTCYEGKVEVKTSESNAKILLPSQQITVRKGSFIKFEEVKDPAPLWKEHILKFDNVPLVNVLTELKKYHSYEFEIGLEFKNRYFTGQIPSNNLAKSVELILHPMKITYKLKDNKLMF